METHWRPCNVMVGDYDFSRVPRSGTFDRHDLQRGQGQPHIAVENERVPLFNVNLVRPTDGLASSLNQHGPTADVSVQAIKEVLATLLVRSMTK